MLYIAVTGDNQNVQADYQAAASGGRLSFVATLALGAMLTSIGEEFVFRGIIANVLNRYGSWIGVLASSTIFALAHGINPVLPAAFVVGVICALLLRRTGSVWPAVMVHGVHNASSVIIPAILALTW